MLAENLSMLRKRNRLSQEELADKLCLSSILRNSMRRS